MPYNRDAAFERKFERQIKTRLGQYFIGRDVVLDLREATDFAIFIIKPVKVAARLRRFEYYKYKDQFTLRWSRPSGVMTEIDKIREGLVEYIIYGFVDQKERKILSYFIGDLKIFREYEPKPIEIFPNNPPDSELAAYELKNMPEGFLLYQYPKQRETVGVNGFFVGNLYEG